MASSLFPNQNSGNNLINRIQNIKGVMGNNPQALFQNMMQNNPQFQQFAQSVKGMTPEEAFQRYGLNYDEVMGLFK